MGPARPTRTSRGTSENVRRRRALTNVGGPVTLRGPSSGELGWLVQALDVREDEDATRRDVHGFHSYPARMHPVTAERLVAGLARAGDTVLDPFCGSGTVLVEARALGCRAVGVDANPLAVELARLKLGGATQDEQRRLVEAAEDAAARAERRRAARSGATRRYGREDIALFDPHVLLELDGLRSGIDATPDPGARRALLLVLSSILTKVSRRRGDTGDELVPKRLASGFTIRIFRAKAEELSHCLGAYQARLHAGLVPFDVRRGDARRLEFVARRSVRAVVTSPPYPGTYDYVSHHAARLRWLRMDAQPFYDSEIGARRSFERLPAPAAAARWGDELAAALAAMARVLAHDGKIALLIGDSVLGGRAVHADDLIRRIARPVGLEVAAVASQERPHFHRATALAFARRPRREHAIVLTALTH